VDRVDQPHVRPFAASCEQAESVHYRVGKATVSEPGDCAQSFGCDASATMASPCRRIVEQQDFMSGLPQEKAEIGARES